MYNSIIIGFGKGGKTLAGALAKKGEKVLLVEKSDKMYGGTCINVGCIPSKSLVTSSKQAELNGNSEFKEKKEFYKKAIEEKRRLTSMLRQKNFDKLNNLDTVTIINGVASFVNDNEILIKTADGEIKETGEKIFINTGSYSFIPNIKGIENNKYIYTSESLMELDVLPERLTIIGGGYIGLEFASMYVGFGSNVTVIQNEELFLPKEDRDIADEIKKAFENRGVKFILNANIVEIKDNVVVYKNTDRDYCVEADAILVATGRRPNTKGLNLENTSVELTERGGIKVDDNMKTTSKNIWAMGDVCGGLQFTYISLDDYRIVLDNLNGENKRSLSERKNVPYSVFISPSFSRVGLNEAEALAKGYDIKVVKMPAGAIPKAQVLKNPTGVLKAIIDKNTNKILGAMLFCEESYEVINIIKLAMDLNADYTVLRDNIFTHPTMSEALNDLFSM